MTNHLERIGSAPRPAGSAAAREAQDYCAGELEKLGFSVERKPFSFSALTGRFGAPIAGVAAAAALISLALIVRSKDHDTLALWGILMPFVAGFARKLLRGGYLDLNALRVDANNLEAVRGTPRVWLVAHIDSKSQPVSTAVRTSGIVLLVLSGLTAFVGILSGTRHPNLTLWNVVILLAVLGALPLLLAVVGNRSDGAADNASGVATVLEAAALVPRDVPLGVLITDGEELALAGANAWVKDREPGIAINCDTIDDDGLTTIFHYQPASTSLPEAAIDAVSVSHAPPSVREETRLTVFGTAMRVMRPLPGVLTDSIPFHRAGWQTVTLSRGSLRTLARIHTRRDSLRELRGTGIPMVARAMAILVEGLS